MRSHYNVENRAPLVAIVDDEEAIRTSLLRLFRLCRFRAEAFASCSEFLAFTTQQEPDCLILDMRLPGMTGIELLRILAGRESCAPTIVVTGDIENTLRDECMALGTRYYFTKPFDGKELIDTVNRILESNH